LKIKEVERADSNSFKRDGTLLELVNKESDSVNESLSIIKSISQKHNIDIRQLGELLKNRERYICIPVGLFRSKLGPLETVVRYLKDILGYNFAQISRLLFRDETTIWTSYKNSVKKNEVIVDLELADIDMKKLKLKKEDLIVPLSVFSERKLSVLEALCLYLRETFGLSYHVIGEIVERNERTIWTVVNRAGKKLDE
jgi:hypothetical protein